MKKAQSSDNKKGGLQPLNEALKHILSDYDKKRSTLEREQKTILQDFKKAVDKKRAQRILQNQKAKEK